MGLDAMHEKIRKHPDYGKVGMVAFHRGVVRATSRNGRPVEAFQVSMDDEVLERLKNESRAEPGIVEVLVEHREGTFAPGEDILLVAVAGDIRDHVFPSLVRLVDRIKTEATRSSEIFST